MLLTQIQKYNDYLASPFHSVEENRYVKRLLNIVQCGNRGLKIALPI